MRFDEYVDAALYGPGGFFAGGGGAGRGGGDFLTSPEVGPLFGRMLGCQLDLYWEQLGSPQEFWVIEAAAGRGALAIAVLASRPRCHASLRYVMVERSEVLRERQRKHLPVLDADLTDGGLTDGGLIDGGLIDGRPSSTVFAVGSLQDAAGLIGPDAVGVVVANELLDNIPFRVLERAAEGWDEVAVARDGDRLVERLAPADEDVQRLATSFAPRARPGERIPLQERAADWLREALGLLRAGRVLVVDYGDETPSMASRPVTEWLRTYRGHSRGDGPLEDPGSQDITCEVAWDQMAAVTAPAGRTTQREWLIALGIDELVEEGRRYWEQNAAAPDLAAFEARSRALEAEALCDPAGLGGFDVVEWIVPADLTR